MYRLIVARNVRRAWAAIERRQPDAVLSLLADGFVHMFAGEHALGGERSSRKTQAAWFARLFRLFPDIHFTTRDVLVAGCPWNTRVLAVIDVAIPSEPDYSNVVIQRLRLRWGRITRIDNLEDTQRLAALLDRRGQQGNPEATAPPLTDPPTPPRTAATDPRARS
jgi:ketosteroid isomerase-like protein